jgi:hypothetical protein
VRLQRLCARRPRAMGRQRACLLSGRFLLLLHRARGLSTGGMKEGMLSR